MYESLGSDYKQGVVLTKACKEQLLGALKWIRLDISIALDSCIGQESLSPRVSSRVVRE